MAHRLRGRDGDDGSCPVCDGEPRVLVAMRHPSMLRFTREFLERECGCWVATEVERGTTLVEALDRLLPDLLVIDAADFPECCFDAVAHIPKARIIVIGPEPDPAYRRAALHHGAGGWLARDEVGERLGPEMRRVLGCRHDPCPPAQSISPRAAAQNSRPERPPRTGVKHDDDVVG